MKVFIYFILFTSIFSESFRISLKKDCEKKSCESRAWYLKDNFNPDYFNSFNTEEFKLITEFPIWVNKFFSNNGNLHEYSFITYFDLKEDKKINHQTGIRFGEIGEVFEVYLNGTLIAKQGIIENNKIKLRRTVRGQVFEFDRDILKPEKNQLLVRIWGDPKYDHTGFYLTNGYDIGFFEELQHEEQDRISLVLIGFYTLVGIYHLFLFLKRKKEKANLYYAIFTIGLGIYLYTRSNVVFENNWDTGIIQKTELSVLYTMVASLFFLLEELFFQKIRKVIVYLMGFCNVLSIFTIFVPLYFAEFILRFWQIILLTIGVSLIVNILYLGIKNKVHNAKRLAFGLIILVISAVYDVIDSLFLNSGIALTKYSFFIFVFGFATILANKFISIHNEIEELNENLEKKVEERTRELTKSLEIVNNLKKQQDGDYYLTSLLINPLGKNKSDKKHITVNFLTEQKKKFHFKGIDTEIGGDLCRSDSVKLKNKKFSVFFNADAMGKSIQGAGGAIVMGAVFDSIIERTKLNFVNQDVYPERWLKNSFIELHKVFESFDCSMLISIAIGLVDEENGFLYYILAEHPFPVLYRDGKASFINVKNLYRKLGMPIHDSIQIEVETFQIKEGDIIIFGSDGRDDIMISGELNIDENLFLKFVETGRGNIESIQNEIKESGSLTDDLSLLSIYLNKELLHLENYDLNQILEMKKPELDRKILTKEKLNLFEIKNILLFYALDKKLTEFENLGLAYMDRLPSDIFILELLTILYFDKKEFLKAIEVADRLLIRGKNTSRIVSILVQSQLLLGNKFKGRIIYRKFIPQFPEIESLKNNYPELYY